MKTKPLLLATAGATVDSRTIEEEKIIQMAEGYDPKTYGARVNVEHIRGLSGDGPFRAFGDVLELSTGQVDVKMPNGQTEQRLGLYGVLDINDDAKALNDAGQKVYPSIEIEPNFAGTGMAYLMGVALTDSPASIATEKMQFNRSLPGTITLAADAPEQAFTIEFAKDAGSTETSDSFLSKLGEMLENAFGKKTPPPQQTEPKAGEEGASEGTGEFSIDALRPLFEDFARVFTSEINEVRNQLDDQADRFDLKFKALEKQFETTPAHQYTPRPAASGAHGDMVKTDC